MVSDCEVNKKEVELINQFKSNDPAVGYNRWPRPRGHSEIPSHNSCRRAPAPGTAQLTREANES
jgi:hypothetical protein